MVGHYKVYIFGDLYKLIFVSSPPTCSTFIRTNQMEVTIQ